MIDAAPTDSALRMEREINFEEIIDPFLPKKYYAQPNTRAQSQPAVHQASSAASTQAMHEEMPFVDCCGQQHRSIPAHSEVPRQEGKTVDQFHNKIQDGAVRRVDIQTEEGLVAAGQAACMEGSGRKSNFQNWIPQKEDEAAGAAVSTSDRVFSISVNSSGISKRK